MQNLPHIPEVLQISSRDVFFDEELADKWYQSISERKAAIACAIGFYTALKFTDPENPDKFQIVSPSTKGYRYQITVFDSFGPVYDIQKDDPGTAAEEINERYVLEEVL